MLDWMAWTWPTAVFFMVIASLLILMTVLAIKFPETPRVGILRIETTRGDRLFITLLGSAFINLAWLGPHGSCPSPGRLVFVPFTPLRFSAGFDMQPGRQIPRTEHIQPVLTREVSHEPTTHLDHGAVACWL